MRERWSVWVDGSTLYGGGAHKSYFFTGQTKPEPTEKPTQRGTFSNHSIGLVRADLKCIHPSIKGAPIHIVSDNLSPPTFGQCPNSNWTPPRTQPGTPGHIFSEQYECLFELQFSLHKSAPNHPSKGLDPAKMSKCPFEYGQFFSKYHPTHKTGNS